MVSEDIYQVWMPWSDQLGKYHPMHWSYGSRIATVSSAWLNKLPNSPGDWRPVRIPPPGTIEALEEVEALAVSGNWLNEPLALEVVKRVRDAIAKANGEGE